MFKYTNKTAKQGNMLFVLLLRYKHTNQIDIKFEKSKYTHSII